MIDVNDLLKNRGVCPLLDVRSPGEFRHGHIPGAVNFPLFTDEERAAVGTLYKQEGNEAAVELGLRFVGPKLESFVREAKELAPKRRLLIHCWRGGQRSGSMAWLFRQAGFQVDTLQGGYKAYRHFVLEGLESIPLKLMVLGGKTGSGKTYILKAMRDMGEQIIDLEGLANHKGSAFGFIGESPQPTVEQFENDLFEAILQLDIDRRIWVENESHSIGKVFMPEAFWQKMKIAPLVSIMIPETVRIENLLRDYVLEDREELMYGFHKIAKKLGGLNHKIAVEALESGDFETAARIALYYYDKTYQHGLDMSPSPDIRHLTFDSGDPLVIARELVKIQARQPEGQEHLEITRNR